MKDEIRTLIEQYANEHKVEQGQALRALISNIKAVCEDLDLDFDFALDKSELANLPEDSCDHSKGFPCGGGGDAIFCPTCNEYVVESKIKVREHPWIKHNVWRDPVVPTE